MSSAGDVRGRRKTRGKAKPKQSSAAAAVERGWYPRAELAAIFGVSISQIDRHYVQLAPVAACRKLSGGKTVYKAREIIDAVVAAELAKKGAASELVGGDPLLDGLETPALEEFRRIRAAQERIKLAEMEKKSVPLEEIEPPLLAVAGVLRRYGDLLVKKFGNEAGELLGEAIEEWVAGCEAQLIKHGGDNH